MTDVAVVGAGIVGASVAFHAASAGAAVVLLDAALPASGVTGESFAWIGGPGGRDAVDGSTPLRLTALEDYRRLERELPDVRVRWSGSVAWGEDALLDLGNLGPQERLVDAAQVARLEPNLRVPPQRAVVRSADGAVDPVGVTEALVAAARCRGADLRVGDTVTRLRVEAGTVVGVDTSTWFVASRTVVLAAGVGVPTLCAPLEAHVPVAASPSLLLRFRAPRGLVRTLVACPEIEVRESSAGHLIAAQAYTGEATREDLQRSGKDALRLLLTMFTGAEDVRLIDVRVGMRPMPADELPIIGPLPHHPGGYVAVMHSAVTLAPAVGRLVAAELVDGLQAGDLQGLRPDRFQ